MSRLLVALIHSLSAPRSTAAVEVLPPVERGTEVGVRVVVELTGSAVAELVIVREDAVLRDDVGEDEDDVDGEFVAAAASCVSP